MTFVPATGRFTGSLLLTDPKPGGGPGLPRTVSFSGLVVAHRVQALGWFLLPSLPGAGTPATQSGLVVVSAAK